MGHGIGKAPIKVGDQPTPETLPIYEGSTPEDMQRWIWSLYRTEDPALVRGGVISGRSNMAYQVEAGVAIFPSGEAMSVAVPFSAGTVATAAAPTSGTRTEDVYVTEDGAVQVAAAMPSGCALLDRRRVPANITSTTATQTTLGDRKYAPLYGASMGVIALWHHNVADLSPITDDAGYTRTMCNLTFTLDSDRHLDFFLQVSYEMNRAANVHDWGWKKASFVWEIWIDDQLKKSVELGVEEFAETKDSSSSFDILAGTHTVQLKRTRRLVGTNDGDDDPVLARDGGYRNWPGTWFKIKDVGQVD